MRPTLDRVRESLFNILAPRLPGVRFLDLFAGSGANGIEALSRGAVSCLFVDHDEQSLRVLRKNLDATGLSEAARVRRLPLPGGLAKLGEEREAFEVVFADPPYAFGHHEKLLSALREAGLLVDQGLIVLEHSSRLELADELGGYRVTRRNRYGDTTLSFYA